MYVLCSGQIRDWRIQASFGEGGGEGWDCPTVGSPSPSPVCFTPSSPATSAEGLCLYNSGYLHWVRKHTHTRASSSILIHLQRRLWKKLVTPHFTHLPSLKLQEGFHQCNMFYIFVLETLLRCLLLKMLAGFIFSAASGAHRDLRFRRAQRIHAAALTVYSCLNVLGRFTVCWGEIQTWGDSHFKLKKLEFSTRTCCQISRLASPVYTLGFNCASLCSVLCKCVVTHHGEYCEPATSTHLILNP